MPRLRLRDFFLALISLSFAAQVQAEDLMDIYRSALENDPQFLAAQYQQQASLEGRQQARSQLLPQVGLSGNIARTESDGDGRGFYHSDSISLSLTQTIYNKADYIGLSQADMRSEQARLEYAGSRQDLILRAAESYFAVLAASDNLEFARSEKNAIARQLEQAERRFEVGLIAITDVKEAQARHDLAIAQEIASENRLANAREAMRVLTGSDATNLRALNESSPLDPPVPGDSEAWVNMASENSLSLSSARLAVEIARESIALQRAARYPDTELVGSYTDSHSDGLMGDSRTTQLRVQVSVPLYAGGAISSRVREARANFEVARQQYETNRRSVEQQTRNAYRNVLAGISRAQALKQALVSTQSGAEATEAGFEVGTRTAVEVLTALRETYSAQADYSSARYDYILELLRLRQAAGVLDVSDLEQVNQWLVR